MNQNVASINWDLVSQLSNVFFEKKSVSHKNLF